MMMTHTYTHMLLVEGEAFPGMVIHLDPSICLSLTPHKLKRVETDSSSLLDDVYCVVISYDLWMSKTTKDIF